MAFEKGKGPGFSRGPEMTFSVSAAVAAIAAAAATVVATLVTAIPAIGVALVAVALVIATTTAVVVTIATAAPVGVTSQDRGSHKTHSQKQNQGDHPEFHLVFPPYSFFSRQEPGGEDFIEHIIHSAGCQTSGKEMQQFSPWPLKRVPG